MNYFVDTNVIIGYIFVLDYLNKKSSNFIDFNKNYYFYSKNVKNEVENVFKLKSRNYQLYLLKLCNFINHYSDYDLIDEFDVHNIINSFNSIGKLDNKEMHFALKVIWNDLSFNICHDAFEVKRMFDDFTNNFQSRHSNKKDLIFDEMIHVPNHTIKDKRILDLIKKENLRDILLHGEDENILFDANEFCKNNKELNLNFVSADQDFLKAMNILKEYLCFSAIINLMEFTNN